METAHKSIGSIEGSSSVLSASSSRVDGHPLNLSVNIFDRALMRRFPDVPPSLSSTSGSAAVVPSPPGVWKRQRRKGRNFIGKGNTKKANISPESRDSLQKRVRSDNPCELMPKLAGSVVPSTSLSSPSVTATGPPGFALLFYTLVKDNAVPIGYLQQFLSLEIPARRATKTSQVSATSI